MKKNLVLGLGILTILSGCGVEGTANPLPATSYSEPTPDSTMEPSSGPTDFINPGTWTVGEDILPGIYKASEIAGDDCYWEISKGDETITNGIGGGKPKITLRKGQTFYSSDCPVWIKQK